MMPNDQPGGRTEKSGETGSALDRAEAIAAIAGGALVVMAAHLEGIQDAVEALQKLDIAEREKAELRELRHAYLCPADHRKSNMGNLRIPLVPGMRDPWGPAKREYSGSGRKVVNSYAAAFRGSRKEEIVKDPIQVHSDDAPVLVASHLVNALSQEYFGDPTSATPVFNPKHHDAKGRVFEAGLRWALYTPEGAETLVRGEPFEDKPVRRAEPKHVIDDRDDPARHYEASFRKQGDLDIQLTDHLLITVFPRDCRFDRRVVSLAGANKPGTLAAEILMRDPQLSLRLLREIDAKVHKAPYYQALIELDVDHAREYDPRPTRLRLIDAEVIQVK